MGLSVLWKSDYVSDYIAFIYNPYSRKNLRNSSNYCRSVRGIPRILFYESSVNTDLHEIVGEIRSFGAQFIVVDGGDGTVGHVMSALYNSEWPSDEWPLIVVVPSGNTNLIAADVGIDTRGAKTIMRLRKELHHGLHIQRVKRRFPIVVSRKGQEGLDVLGFFGGLGAFGRGIEIAHKPRFLKTLSHNIAVATAFCMTSMQLLRPSVRKKWMQGVQAQISCDEVRLTQKDHFMFLCTGLQKLPYNVWPFWTGGRHNESGLSYLNIKEFPEKLTKVTLSLLQGKSPFWLRSLPSYQSGLAQEIKINTSESFVLDGEILSPGTQNDFLLRCGPSVAFFHA